MFRVRKKSRWSFKTSGGVSMSAEFVTGGIGQITLTSPFGHDVKFTFTGGGVAAGFKSPGYGGSGSSEDLFSSGDVYLLEGYPADELNRDDFEGGYISIDASVGVLVSGYSGSWMLLGIPGADMIPELLRETAGAPTTWIVDRVWPSLTRSRAKALLLTGGHTVGSVGGSVGISIGYMWSDAPKVAPPPGQSVANIDLSTIEVTTTRSALPSQDEADVIHLPGDALFAFARYDIKPAADAVLQQAAALIQQKSPRALSVEGHTDSMGPSDYNFNLSHHRANAVKHWLDQRNVMKASAIETKGWGKMRPVAPNTRADGVDDPQGRQKNRRVEIWLIR